LVLADGKISRRPVTLGLSSENLDSVEVRDGLKPGEQVLLAKLDNFKEGMAALLKNPAAAPVAANPAVVKN